MALKDKLMTLEDFKAVRDVDVASNSAQFTEIKADLGALDSLSIYTIDESLWTQGAVSAAYGNLVDNEKRITQTDVIRLDGQTTKFVADNGYVFMVFKYAKDGTYIGALNVSGVYEKASANIKLCTEYMVDEADAALYNYRLALKKESNDNISASDSGHLSASLLNIASYVKKSESGLSNDAKLALLDCLDHLMWEGGSGQGYIDTLREALNVQPVHDNPFEGAEYEIGAFGYNQASDGSSGVVTKNDTLTTRVRTTAPVSCTHGRVIAKTGYEINLYMLNSQSYGEWSSSITGYNDLAYIGTSYYQWSTEKEILTGTRYCLLVVRKTSGDSFTQEEAENIYDTGFVYEEV